jgi:hypothetical protein
LKIKPTTGLQHPYHIGLKLGPSPQAFSRAVISEMDIHFAVEQVDYVVNIMIEFGSPSM